MDVIPHIPLELHFLYTNAAAADIGIFTPSVFLELKMETPNSKFALVLEKPPLLEFVKDTRVWLSFAFAIQLWLHKPAR